MDKLELYSLYIWMLNHLSKAESTKLRNTRPEIIEGHLTKTFTVIELQERIKKIVELTT